MNYCVIKDSTIIIEGSSNPIEIMLKNASNAGFTVEKVEILTQVQFDERKSLEPIPEQQPTQEDFLLNLELRMTMLELGLTI